MAQSVQKTSLPYKKAKRKKPKDIVDEKNLLTQ